MEELRIIVDSGTGYGWRIDGKERSLQLTDSMKAESRDWSGGDQGRWQCWLELRALEECLKEEFSRLAGRMVLVRPDASTTVAAVNGGGGGSGDEANLDAVCTAWRCAES